MMISLAMLHKFFNFQEKGLCEHCAYRLYIWANSLPCISLVSIFYRSPVWLAFYFLAYQWNPAPKTHFFLCVHHLSWKKRCILVLHSGKHGFKNMTECSVETGCTTLLCLSSKMKKLRNTRKRFQKFWCVGFSNFLHTFLRNWQLPNTKLFLAPHS